MSAAPDYVEVVSGWRVWLVIRHGQSLRLQSVVYPTLWEPGREVVARCLRYCSPLAARRGRRRVHAAPDSGCDCGIYASKLDDVAHYLSERRPGPVVARAIGSVSLWGSIIECEHGWRASHAYPSSLFVSSSGDRSSLDADQAAMALSDYGVPIRSLRAYICDELVAGIRAAA